MLFGEFPLNQDLSLLSRKLNQHNIAHRFTEEQGVQKLWLQDAAHVAEINAWLTDMDSLGSDGLQEPEPAFSSNPPPRFTLVPVVITLSIILCGVLGYLLVFFNAVGPVNALLFAPLSYLMKSGEFWRLYSPVFLHFSVMHIVFNALWIWEVGKRLEPFMGKAHYFGVFIFCALVSNIFQYVFSGQVMFGGLSGVVYGYFGCNFVLYRRWPAPRLMLPPAIYAFMLVWLIIGFVGLIDFFIAGQVANWAHLGGLLAGLAYAGFYKMFAKPPSGFS